MIDEASSGDTSNAETVAELAKAVRQKLAVFNPGVEYETLQIVSVLRTVIKSGRVRNVILMPDLNRLNTKVTGDDYLLLVNLACKIFVDLVMSPKLPTRKRIPKHQKDFAFELENEIHYLENGEEGFFGISQA